MYTTQIQKQLHGCITTQIYKNTSVSNCNICEDLKEITLEILTYSKQYKALENKIIVNKICHTYFLYYTLFVSQIMAREIVFI